MNRLTLRQKLWIAERDLRAAQAEAKELRQYIRAHLRPEDRLWFDYNNTLCYTHNCLGTKVDARLEGWTIQKNGHVTPSIHCTRCGAHFTADVTMSLFYTEGFRPWDRYGSATPILPRGVKEREETDESSNGHAEDQYPSRDGGVQVERGAGGP